jgi:hypothetical protein
VLLDLPVNRGGRGRRRRRRREAVVVVVVVGRKKRGGNACVADVDCQQAAEGIL